MSIPKKKNDSTKIQERKIQISRSISPRILAHNEY